MVPEVASTPHGPSKTRTSHLTARCAVALLLPGTPPPLIPYLTLGLLVSPPPLPLSPMVHLALTLDLLGVHSARFMVDSSVRALNVSNSSQIFVYAIKLVLCEFRCFKDLIWEIVM